MRRSRVGIVLLAVAAAIALSPHSSSSQVQPDDVAARTLLATNLADAVINPAKGEDTNFFIRAGGIPNIFFLVDTSGSMERLPADGPAFYGGASPTMPPGVLLADPTNAGAQNTARNNRTILGCGLDAVSSSTPAFSGNEMILHLKSRKFFPPCGAAQDPSLVGAAYAGHPGVVATGADYAYQSSICPYYTPSNNLTVWPDNRGGFDPDFYVENPNDSQIPNTLWVKDLVYHDSILLTGAYARNGNAFGHNFGKGWAATAPPTTYPVQSSAGAYASIDAFCDEQGTTALANGQVPSDVCKQCLKQAGWYYDGIILDDDQDGSGVAKTYPSIWYTGNYLNFFPPKFVIVRKIVKDIVATQSKVRMALAQFGASGMSLMKEFNPTCAHPESNFDSNRGTYVNLMNSMDFSGGTPLANALFDTGRYYHSPGLPWFGNAWEKTGNSWESSANSTDYAVCYACQSSNVIVLTDGIPSPNDGNGLPNRVASLANADSGKYAGDTGTGILQVDTTDCPQCAEPTFTGTSSYKNNLARVSWYLHNYDLRNDTEATKDCKKNGGKQTLDVYTVGYATRQLPDANRILANAAGAGGGVFVSAENPQVLKQGLLNVFEEINSRSTSFSVATVSTLQTTTGHSVIVPRFDPSKTALWKGHLYRYEMYSEFVNECDPSNPKSGCCSASGTGDLDCDGKCLSVFLQDAGDAPLHTNPYFIQEAGDGAFYRNASNLASCDQAPICQAQGKPCDDPGNALAVPWWDAGEGLAKKKWKDRKVYTVVDSSGGGDVRIDHWSGTGDEVFQLSSTDDLVAERILPYLGNKGNTVCNVVANRIETAGDPGTATVVRTNETACVQAVIRWVLGADVFNEAGRKASDSPPWPPPRPYPLLPITTGDPTAVPPIPANLPDQEQLPDRPFKLGDVFHSSPVEVVAPLPRTGILCRLGLHNQCLQALWRAPSGMESSDDDAEYDKYVDHYKGRRKIVLVGSNAGLLHAFNGGAWHANADDEFTYLDESKPPFNGYYDRGTPTASDPDQIWAEELWAFLPPDMIGKLPLVLTGEHQLLVDGTAMVRDVWVDGTENGMGGADDWDDKKQAREFHTVAVVGERRGGTHFFALDVTDATHLPSESDFKAPRFLWIYPQIDDRETLSFGETYTDFLPVPPPIGPVRIKADSNSGAPKADTPAFNKVPFHERWIVFLSGGYDPQFIRGRGVHMVNVWTGEEVWDFSYPESPSSVAADDPRLQLRFPVAAVVGMTMWGPEARRKAQLGYGNEGFFDTATFGDTGGQLWTLRFHEPGVMDADRKVTNWYGARAFQMGGATTPSLAWAHPFFYITANTALPDGYIYRAYVGVGDRFNLLDTGGGICGPDNVRACAQRGCTVTIDLPSNYATTPELGRRSGSNTETGTGALTSSSSLGAGGASIGVRAKLVVSGCPSPESNTAPNGFTKDVGVTCANDAQGRWGCSLLPGAAYAGTLALSDTNNIPVTRNWYFSLRIFDDAPGARVPFATAAQAKAYDAARLWIRDTGAAITSSAYSGGNFTIMAASDPNPAVPADPKTSAGWAIYYDHGPTVVAEGNSYTVNALDERTSSVSGLYGWVSWNTTQPSTGLVTTTNANCFVSKCSAEDRRIAYHYAAHPLTGGSVLRDASDQPIRAQVGNTLVPAQGDQATVFINQKGQVLVGLTVVNPEKGAGSSAVGEATDAVMDLGYIEIPQSVHACRHSPTRPAENVCR